MFYVQQAIFSPLKRIRLHEEIRKAWHEECSRFCWKIWCWGKNLTSKQKQWEQKRITSLKRTTKEKKTTPFFSKRGRVQYKNNELKLNTDVPYSRMSLETFQMAQRIILSFNPITKSLGKFERRFKWLNCANIYLQCETEPTVDL